MTSQLDIANRSLLSVGARVQISSLNPSDNSIEANAISVKEELIHKGEGHWQLVTIDGRKVCTKCKVFKPLEDFL